MKLSKRILACAVTAAMATSYAFCLQRFKHNKRFG